MATATKQAIFEYECRRCKKIDGSTYFAAEGAGMKLVSTTTEFNPDPMLPLISVHRCEDGGEGVTDLIGYRVEGPKE